MAEKRSVRVSTPFQFPLPPKDASLEASRYFRDLELYIQSLILRLQLPAHTKGLNQFLRHDANNEKLSWQEVGTVVLVGKAGVDSASPAYITAGEIFVRTTLVKADTIILLTAQDSGIDNITACVKSRVVGKGFTIHAANMAAPVAIGYALCEFTSSGLGGTSGTCPLVKTGVVNGSASFANGTTIIFTWNALLSKWDGNSAGWYLFDSGTQFFVSTPAPDAFAVADTAQCPPNGVYTQAGAGLPGATLTIT